MLPSWTILHRRFALLAVALAAGVTGCGQPLGPPERFPTTTVTGVVVEAGQPVGGGWIELIPVDGTVGDQRSARLARDGTFRADHVAIGEVGIRLVNAPIRIPQGWRFGQFSSPIRRKTSGRPAGPIRIDLMDEMVLFQANQPRRPKLDPGLEPTRPERADGEGR